MHCVLQNIVDCVLMYFRLFSYYKGEDVCVRTSASVSAIASAVHFEQVVVEYQNIRIVTKYQLDS